MKVTLIIMRPTACKFWILLVLLIAVAPAFAFDASFCFIENKGQITDQNRNSRTDIDFKLQDNSLNIFVGKGQIHYQWLRQLVNDSNLNNEATSTSEIEQHQYETYRLDVVLLGANKNAQVVTGEAEEYYEHYYLTQCPNGITAHSFRKIIYRDIYPNIDWVLYTSTTEKGNVFKYDFVVHAGADASKIRLQYNGADSIVLDNGNINTYTPLGNITETKPYCYDATTKQEVPSTFILHNNIVSFDVEQTPNVLVIDPALYWCTYFYGRNVYDDPTTSIFNGLAADSSGNAFISGYTSAISNIATTAAHQSIFGGDADAFIVKFNPAGGRIWATYYGGADKDYPKALACDMRYGDVYVTGYTYSPNSIATPGAHQTSLTPVAPLFPPPNPKPDAFLAKFSATGQMGWATYYGGDGHDASNAIACDMWGNVYISGITYSASAIATAGAFKTSFDSAFIVKFNSAGIRTWGTYHPGIVNALACDTSGNIYAGGRTSVYNNFSTAGSHQTLNGSYLQPEDDNDGFLVKFDSFGTRKWCTYYGGIFFDEVLCVACDKRKNIFIGGITHSPNTTLAAANSIATSNVHKSTLSANMEPSFITYDGFLAKFNAEGIRQWGTYFGDTCDEMITSISCDASGVILVSGATNSTKNIATSNAYKPSPAYGAPQPAIHKILPDTTIPPLPPMHDAFWGKFDQSGKLLYSTYFGGINGEDSSFIRYGKGRIYLSGNSGSSYQITTAGSFQPGEPIPSKQPGHLGFLAQFDADTALYIDQWLAGLQLCLGDTLQLAYGVTNNFRPSNRFIAQLSDNKGSFTTPVNIGVSFTNTGGGIQCAIPNNIPPGQGYKIRLISTSRPDTSWDYGETMRISEYPKPGPFAISPICAGGSLQLSDSGSSPAATTYVWTGPGNFKIGMQTYARPNVQFSDSGHYILIADNFGCVRIDSTNVTVYFSPEKPTIAGKSNLCVGDSLHIEASTASMHPDLKWNWQKPSGYSENRGPDTTIYQVALADAGLYRTVAVLHGCFSEEDTLNVTINPSVMPTVQINASTGPNPGPWVDVLFTAVGFSNQGNNPTYQWTKNNVSIPGATKTTYAARTVYDIQSGDTVCVILTSSAACANPNTAKNCIGIDINLNIDDLTLDTAISVYPNPTNGDLTIKSKQSGALHIYTLHGQKLSSYHITTGAHDIHLPEYLAEGIYMGKFYNETTRTTFKIVLRR